jgi:PHD/YefM family antitoxin component YafN of YafNO toxin-antitoxin module
MASRDIQFVSNENGEPTAVIVPIELWREIESERETAYLLKSETMKARLLAAKQRQDGIPFEAAIGNLEFDPAA